MITGAKLLSFEMTIQGAVFRNENEDLWEANLTRCFLFCFVFGEKAVITNDFSRLTLQGVVLSCRHAVTVMGTLFAVTSFLSISIYSWRTFLFTWAFEILAMDFRQTPDSQWHLAACFLTVGTLVTAQHFIKMSHRKSLNVTIDLPL